MIGCFKRDFKSHLWNSNPRPTLYENHFTESILFDAISKTVQKPLFSLVFVWGCYSKFKHLLSTFFRKVMFFRKRI